MEASVQYKTVDYSSTFATIHLTTHEFKTRHSDLCLMRTYEHEMLSKLKWILMFNGLLLCSLCVDKTYSRENNRVIGNVRNLTVEAYEDIKYLEENDIHSSLKLNISWLPPIEGRQPSSYSVIVTSITHEDTNQVECPEESLYYTSQDGTQHSVLLPQNNLLLDMPEMHIRPNCSYKIQVFANPRLKPMLQSSEVIYTVPECVGKRCSCADAKSLLPTPNVNVEQQENNIKINWDVNSDDSHVQFYTISIGVPLLISKAGLPVYNITNIGNTTARTFTFLWNSDINEMHTELKTGYKVLVAARDRRGCFGTEGAFILDFEQQTSSSQQNITWPTFLGIICICIILGTIVCIHGKKYQLICTSNSSGMQSVGAISKCTSQWVESFLQKHNVLYVQQEVEEPLYEKDEFEISFKSIKFTRELGKGQFGKVFLGTLDDQTKTLVAVKMGQSSDMSGESEERRQFLEEIEMMKMAGPHPYLVKLIGYCTLPDKPVCIILEYMQGGDLLGYLRLRRTAEKDEIIYCTENSSGQTHRPSISETLYTTLSSQMSSISSCSLSKLSMHYSKMNFLNKPDNPIPRYVNTEQKNHNEDPREKLHGRINRHQFIKFALDIAKGMQHLESKGITHRDLAARNILLTSDLTLKISDFGLSRNGVYVMNNAAGIVRHLPIRWMSPEALRDRAFSAKSDVWSYAIVLWEIATLGSFPYPNIQDHKLLQYIIQEQGRLEQPEGVSHDIYRLMQTCWASQPEDRPSFAQLVTDLQILSEPSQALNATSNPCYVLLPKG